MTLSEFESVSERPADGMVTRRTVLGRSAFLPLGIAAGVVGLDVKRAVGNLSRGAATDWETFLEKAVPAAKAALEEGNLERYSYTIASLAAELDEVPQPDFSRFGSFYPPVELGIVHRGSPFIVIHWKLAPGAFLPAHCHPKTSVCTVGLAGEARLRNFEIAGTAPDFNTDSTTPFDLRETKSEVMRKGRINTLSPDRDNIHCFHAGRDGARGIDITTPHGGDGKFSFLTLDYRKPVDAENRLFEATWTGRDENGAIHPVVKR